MTIEHIMARARAGEERALDALRETGYYLGRGFATIIKAIDPRRIYVGGEITAAWDLVAATVRDALHEDAIIREAGETEILTVALDEHPAAARRRRAHPHPRLRRGHRVRDGSRPRPRRRPGREERRRGAPPIDRHALVRRHHPVLKALDTAIAALGRERRARVHRRRDRPADLRRGLRRTIPLGTLSQWGWHTAPNPQG